MSDLVRELRSKAQQSTRTDKRWDDHVAWRGADEIERLRARNAELLEALAPFADVDGEGEDDFADDTPVTVKMGRSIFYALVLGDFRRARRIHDKHEGSEE